MAIDLKNTYTLTAAYELVEKPASFLRDNYFPTNVTADVFATDEVLIDFDDDAGQKAAPLVAPVTGSSEYVRSWFKTSQFKPGLICPKGSLTIDDLKRRGFGEAIFSNLTPDAREVALLMRDLTGMDKMITRREEIMAAEVLRTDGLVLTPTAGGTANVIKFHDSDNPYVYTSGKSWEDPTADIIGDIHNMILMLTRRGRPATDLIVSGDVEAMLLKNEQIYKLLDIRRIEVGNIAPKLSNGAALIGVINVFGYNINLIGYGATYQADNGDVTPYLPAGTAILTAPAAGRGLYGAITQIEQLDGQFHSYTGTRVPKYISDATANTRTLQLSAAPLFVPRYQGGWICGNVLGG